MIELLEAETPAFAKLGFFGDTGTGKTYTAAKVMSQFIARYQKGSQLAMFDTEPGAGYIKAMVKEITGKPLLAIASRSFSDLVEFAETCKAKKYVALLDSATHPWRSLVNDYIEAKKSRVKGAGGREDTVRLSLKDWGPIKEIWGRFSEKYCYDPVHWCMCGREGDRWDDVENDEGEKELKKVGVKMKTETETGYEPACLVQMRLIDTKHYAFVIKDRFDVLTGKMSGPDPDIEFFMPYFDALSIDGKHSGLSKGKKVFRNAKGENWETIQARRDGILENIKDDLLLAWPSTSAKDKQAKTAALRRVFGTSSWTELTKDTKRFSEAKLTDGRKVLATLIQEANSHE